MKIGVVGLDFENLKELAEDFELQVLYVDERLPRSFSGEPIEEIKLFYPRVNDEECIRCASCFAACVDRALVWTPHGGPRAIPQLCSGCKACYYACKDVTGAIKEDVQTGGILYRNERVYVLVSDYQKMSATFKKVIESFEDIIFSVPPDKGNLAAHGDEAFCLKDCQWLQFPSITLEDLKARLSGEFRE